MLGNTVKHSIDNRKNIVNSLLKIIDITSFNFHLAIYEQIWRIFLNKALDHTQLGLYLICFVNSPAFSGVINGFSGVITVSSACFGGVFTGIQCMFLWGIYRYPVHD